MNLYLYIPPQPSHPPCCFKGLITGKLKRYFIKNNKEDFKKIYSPNLLADYWIEGTPLKIYPPYFYKQPPILTGKLPYTLRKRMVQPFIYTGLSTPREYKGKPYASYTIACLKILFPLRRCR
jgi:hypothetical protein